MAYILAVDSGDHDRLKQELRTEGHDVAIASSGVEALELMIDRQPDLVILDVALPDVDGPELVQRILCLDCTLPVILYSTFSGMQDNVGQWPADSHILKSGEFTELKDEVRRHLEKRVPEYA